MFEGNIKDEQSCIKVRGGGSPFNRYYSHVRSVILYDSYELFSRTLDRDERPEIDRVRKYAKRKEVWRKLGLWLRERAGSDRDRKYAKCDKAWRKRRVARKQS